MIIEELPLKMTARKPNKVYKIDTRPVVTNAQGTAYYLPFWAEENGLDLYDFMLNKEFE